LGCDKNAMAPKKYILETNTHTTQVMISTVEKAGKVHHQPCQSGQHTQSVKKSC
jgi:hypothetical protein